MSKTSTRLVIDASIARSAGSTDAPSSTNCRQFLELVLDNKLKMVATKKILAEWANHKSRYASTWLTSMYARRLVATIVTSDFSVERHVLSNAGFNQNELDALLKDFHLIEAAIDSDNRVCSLDETVRKLLAKSCNKIACISRVLWVNPNLDVDKAHDWIMNGAPDERHRRLCNHKVQNSN